MKEQCENQGATLLSRGPARGAGMIATFLLVALAWIFFRCKTLEEAERYLIGLLTWQSGAASGAAPITLGHGEVMAALLLIAILLLCIDLPQALAGRHEAMLRWPLWLRAAVIVILGACILLRAIPARYLSSIFNSEQRPNRHVTSFLAKSESRRKTIASRLSAT